MSQENCIYSSGNNVLFSHKIHLIQQLNFKSNTFITLILNLWRGQLKSFKSMWALHISEPNNVL